MKDTTKTCTTTKTNRRISLNSKDIMTFLYQENIVTREEIEKFPDVFVHFAIPYSGNFKCGDLIPLDAMENGLIVEIDTTEGDEVPDYE